MTEYGEGYGFGMFVYDAAGSASFVSPGKWVGDMAYMQSVLRWFSRISLASCKAASDWH